MNKAHNDKSVLSDSNRILNRTLYINILFGLFLWWFSNHERERTYAVIQKIFLQVPRHQFYFIRLINIQVFGFDFINTNHSLYLKENSFLHNRIRTGYPSLKLTLSATWRIMRVMDFIFKFFLWMYIKSTHTESIANNINMTFFNQFNF